jgi:DNA-binding Lrp family transcriptional regulator
MKREDGMNDAYILIQTEVGKSANVTSTVGGIDGVTAVDAVTGPYDVIVRASAKTLDALSRGILSKIQQVDGVTRTLTCPIVRF